MAVEIKSLAEFIKLKRQQVGVSQNDLGKKLGFGNGQFISNIENGKCSLPLDKCELICKELKCSPSTLKQILIFEYSKKINKLF